MLANLCSYGMGHSALRVWGAAHHNRGLGAADGQLLGSVPGDVAKNAACDVLIIQTADQDGQPSGRDGSN